MAIHVNSKSPHSKKHEKHRQENKLILNEESDKKNSIVPDFEIENQKKTFVYYIHICNMRASKIIHVLCPLLFYILCTLILFVFDLTVRQKKKKLHQRKETTFNIYICL